MGAMNQKLLDRLCLCLVLFVFLLSGIWLLTHFFKEERLFWHERDEQNKYTSSIEAAEKNIQRLKGANASIENELRELHREMPEEPEIGSFLKELDSSAKKHGVVLISVQPQPIMKEKAYEKIPIRLNCRGSFPDIYNLLQDIDGMERIVVAERLLLGKAETSGICELGLTASIFVSGEKRPNE